MSIKDVFSVLALAAILFDRVEPFGRLSYEEKLSLNYLKNLGQQYAAFHQGLHCLLQQRYSSDNKNTFFMKL